MPKLKKFTPYAPKPAPESHPAYRISTHQIALGILDKKDYLRPGTVTQMQLNALANKYLKEHKELLMLRESVAKQDFASYKLKTALDNLSICRAQGSEQAYRLRKYVNQMEAMRAEIKELRNSTSLGHINESAIIRAQQKVVEKQKRKGQDTRDTLKY